MDLDALKKSLPKFSLNGTNACSAVLAYRQFYRLDRCDEFTDVRQHFGIETVNGFDVATHFFERENARGTVIFMHGYLDHVGLFAPLIHHLLSSDYSVLACDMPGHGLSSGERMGIGDFAQYTDVLEHLLTQYTKQLPKPLTLLGQSMGGAVIMDLLLNRNGAKYVNKAVVFAPLVRPVEWFSVQWRYLFGRYIVKQVPRIYMENSHDADFLHFVRTDPLQSAIIPVTWVGALVNWVPRFLRSQPCDIPLQIIQGDDETTVDWRYNVQQIQIKFPASRVHMVAGGRHHLANESGSFREQVYQQLDECLSC